MINTRLSNSVVTHAVSASPEGPYEAADCAMHTCAPEAHEPSVARDPRTGEWVMWFTSSKAGPGGAPLPGGWSGGACDCTSAAALNATCPLRCPANCSDNCATGCQAGGWNRQAGMPTFMSHAPGPGGPWSAPVRIETPECDEGADPSQDLCLDSNFAALAGAGGGIGADGSVLAVGRQARYVGADWRNASSYAWANADGLMGEDPFLYKDPRNSGGGGSGGGSGGGGGGGGGGGPGVLHMLRHTGRNTTGAAGNFGTHQFSEDGGLTWRAFADVHAYGCEATYEDGSAECLIMRERPHLVMDPKTGVPLALSTGAMRGPYRYPEWLNARSFTHMQKINQQ